jgi:hypothetical protein
MHDGRHSERPDLPLFARRRSAGCVRATGCVMLGPHGACGWLACVALAGVHCLWRVVYRRSSPIVCARLTASSRLCTPSRWYKRSARSFAADREMPNLSAMTEKGTGCGR